MNMIRHQAVTEYLELINLLPLLKIREVVLEITAFDEHRLAVMAALNNMVGKTGHNHPGLSWHQLLLAFEAQNPFCAVEADLNRTREALGSDSSWLLGTEVAGK